MEVKGLHCMEVYYVVRSFAGLMKILFVGEESMAMQIGNILHEDEFICWHTFRDLDDGLQLGEYDVAILDFGTGKSDILSNLIKLNCHKLKPVLVLVGNISVREENCIWGMGVTDVIKLPFTKDECRKKIDNTYRWKWYYDRCNCRNKNALIEWLKENDL